ncbi:hypothetical protein DFQ29_006977, partial [Apophysomyces sp. BC1021]
YGITDVSHPAISNFTPFDNIQSDLLQTPLQELIQDIKKRRQEKYLSGLRGNRPVDYSVHSRQTGDYTLGVTEVKKENFEQGVAQNAVQLEAALASWERKRNRGDDGEGNERVQ